MGIAKTAAGKLRARGYMLSYRESGKERKGPALLISL
jgi:hypothetical protein